MGYPEPTDSGDADRLYKEAHFLWEQLQKKDTEIAKKNIRIKVLEEVRCEACLMLLEFKGICQIGEVECPRRTNAAIPCPGELAIKERLEALEKSPEAPAKKEGEK